MEISPFLLLKAANTLGYCRKSIVHLHFHPVTGHPRLYLHMPFVLSSSFNVNRNFAHPQVNMDTEKSSSSSFEDLTNAEDTKDIRKVAAEAAAGDGVTPSEIAADKDPAKEEEESESDSDILGNKQLIKRTLKKAPKDAPTALRGDLVTINFTGKLDNGKVVDEGLGFQCHVGDYEVAQGVDMVLPMLQVGEVAQIIVDPRFGYGNLGLKKDNESEYTIPPDAKVCKCYSYYGIRC